MIMPLGSGDSGGDSDADGDTGSLLAIDCRSGDDGAADVVREFAGGAAILMHLECIDCRLRDMTEPWEARARPDQRLDDPAGDA